jgi:hypothetical protein
MEEKQAAITIARQIKADAVLLEMNAAPKRTLTT